MATVNIGSIMSKVQRYAGSSVGKKQMASVIEQCKKDGVSLTAGGGKIMTEDMMHAAALELITELQRTARRLQIAKLLQPSVVQHFDSLQASAIQEEDGSCVIYISFMDDLSRMSLLNTDTGKRTGDGVDNIIALFEYGYYANGAVHGYWESRDSYTWSRSMRDGLGFMRTTIQRFNMKYSGNDYNCYAELMWDE